MKKHAMLLGAVLLIFLSALSSAQAPVPFINLPLLPDATAPGGPQFTLTVNGTGFVSNSVINWNGTPLATQFISGSQLTATVPAADIATASTGWVTVVNPAPGGGTSNNAFFTVTASAAYLAFNVASSTAIGSGPKAMAVGDFNGDGKLDLAVANNCYGFSDCNVNWPGTVSILLGDGAGNFTLTSTVSTGEWSWPTSIAVGDFNGDGKLDLAITDWSQDTVSILLGDGTGNFTLASRPGTGNYCTEFVAAGDFNGDGKLDLAVANSGATNSPGTVSILLGDGTGNFTLHSSIAEGGGPVSLAVGDFNGDGNLDLAVASWGSNALSILLGDGTGNFTPFSSPVAGSYEASVVTGDFNHDGKLDLAVTSSAWSEIWIMLGDGAGNFSLAATLEPTNDIFNPPVLADFNGDNNLDLAVGGYYYSKAFVLLGDGTDNFNPNAFPPTGGSNPIALAVGDFNGDGKLDLAALNAGNDTVSILLQVPPYPIVTLSQSSLSFAPQLIGTTSSPQAVTLTNTGSAILNLSSIMASAGFGQNNNCVSNLAVGASCTINVVFRPHTIGTVTGTVTIADNASPSPQVISLSGVGTAVTLLPSTLSFGNQIAGTTSPPQTVALTNYGTRALTILGITISGGIRFAQTNNCPGSLPVGGSCTISVAFTPSQPQPYSATLSVTDNGGASPQSVALSGTGVLPVMFSPSSLSFTIQLVGTQSSPQYVTMSNPTGTTINITSVVASTNFIQTNDCGSSLGAGASCTITVTFSPLEGGNLNGSVTVTDNSLYGQQKVPLTGIATAMTLLPSSLDFGRQKVGTTSPPQTVTLTNVGSKTVSILGVAIGGGKEFAQTNNCGTTVPAGGTCTISVTFAPPGAYRYLGTLEVNDSGGASPQTVPLSGTGVR